ncbi:MAG TPA: ROK family protein [Candidatus Saccharimonadales bacterium]|nr:ROK family protein [Candidatus Saccharimonadales bacterium]
MYAAVDIGGTKTLVASLDDNGVITEKIRFETPKDYELFVLSVKRAANDLAAKEFRAGGVGAPGKIDRRHGRGVIFPHLPGWHGVPLCTDLERILHCPMVLENDAKMAALSEAMMVKHEYSKVLYVTVSTGIGYGLVVDRRIDTSTADLGASVMLVEHKGTHEIWEDFASGSAIVKTFGKKAQDITDKRTWHSVVRNLRPGLLELIAITEPEIIVIGGSVGTYFERYGDILRAELTKYETPLLRIPELRGAARPEEAVLFGCYDLAKATFVEIPGPAAAGKTEERQRATAR